jgi:hypothetical protein
VGNPFCTQHGGLQQLVANPVKPLLLLLLVLLVLLLLYRRL